MPSPNGHQPTPNEDCAKLRDFLPFYVAGTLNTAVHANVQTHLTTCENCRALAAAWESVAQGVRAESELRVGANVPNLNLRVESRRHRGHKTMMRHSLSINTDALNPTTYDANPRKSARRYGLMTGLVAMFAALVLMSIQIIGRVMPLGQYAAPNPTAPALTIFDTLQPITTQNADQLQIINRFGRGTVQDIDWSPDGTTLAIAATTGVYLYTPDAETPERSSDSPYVTQKLGDSSARITALDYSPDGQTLAVVADAQVELWDAVTGGKVTEFDAPTDAVNVEFSPNGETLLLTACLETANSSAPACWREPQTFSVFQVSDHQQIATWDGLLYPLATFSPDGGRIAVSGWDEIDRATTVTVVNIAGETLMTYILEGREITGLRFSPDASQLGILSGPSWSSGSDNPLVTILDMTTLSDTPVITFPVERNIVGFDFTADGQSIRYIANWTGMDEEYQTYSTRALDQSAKVDIRLEDEGKIDAFRQASPFYQVAFAPTVSPIRFAVHVPGVKILIVEMIADNVRLVGSASDFLNVPSDSVFAPSSLAQPLLAFRNARHVDIWDYETGERIAQFDTGSPYILPNRRPAFSPDGELAFSLVNNLSQRQPPVGVIGVWDANAGFNNKTITDGLADLHEMVYTPDGNLIAAGSGMGYAVGIWREGEDGTFTFTDLDGVGDLYNRRGGLFSPDGSILGFSSCIPPNPGMDCPGQVGFSLYNTITGERLLEFPAGLSQPFSNHMTHHIDEEHAVVAVTGCADASGDLDERPNFGTYECYRSKLIAWDVSGVLDGTADEPRELFALDSDLEYLGPIAIDPDAQLIAARIELDTFSVISLASATESGEVIAQIPFSETVTTLTFNDEGTLLAVGGEGTITLYGVPNGQP